MKKILTIAACAVLSIIGSKTFAQTANLNITLSDVLSFTVSQPAGLSVNFDSETKYNAGITALATDHISVVSSRGYVIKAKAGTVTGTAALAPGTVKLTSTIGATNSGNITGLTFQNDVVLPASAGVAATIVTATNSSWDGTNSTNKFNISYLIGANGVYAGKATGVNVIPVIYTVTQP
ncbi:MAG: hypothetical protein V4539_24135 [Bacteroidota bacterium]